MKIGYPCINNSIAQSGASTFRLSSYSENRLIRTINANLSHLVKILQYNVKNNLLFFRVSSGLVPFASHPICKVSWSKYFDNDFKQIGDYIKKHNIRISMHPDQFVILNSYDDKILHNSIRELNYHCNLLDTMGLDNTAKVQIHVGGVYGNKPQAIDRFIKTYNFIDHSIKERLVIENDDHLYNLKDCLYINEQTGIPVVFDNLHHECFGSNTQELRIDREALIRNPLEKAMSTWKNNKDGLPIVDYSSSQFIRNTGNSKFGIARKGKHTVTIDPLLFKNFLKQTDCLDFDIMLEIKDKEKSALKALEIARDH